MERGLHSLPCDLRLLCSTEDQLHSEGWTVFRLPQNIVDKDSFFDAVRQTLPLDPPLMTNRSWDALADSLWQGLYCLPNNRLAIIWPDSNALATGDAKDYKTVVGILTDCSELLADATATNGRTKTLAVILAQQSASSASQIQP